MRIAIAGYGNLGRGVESAVSASDDMELVALFTRRDPSTVKTVTDVPVYKMEKAAEMKDEIDV
ncbi:MAG: diaminopimelate dehydrogenase, partial [Clostridia bacterium]|nr:diaminopimelate dehydrogenase [Clostridia bacterium]